MGKLTVDNIERRYTPFRKWLWELVKGWWYLNKGEMIDSFKFFPLCLAGVSLLLGLTSVAILGIEEHWSYQWMGYGFYAGSISVVVQLMYYLFIRPIYRLWKSYRKDIWGED